MKVSKKLGLAGVAAVALVGGTWAYYTATLSLENPLDTGHYENVVIEDYTPPTDVVQPGAEITKEVGAKNTGDYPVMVRIKMDESWDRGTKNLIEHHSSEESKFNIEANEKGLYLANQMVHNNAPTGTTGDTDGLVEGDATVVAKILKTDRWVFNGKDGYWYYNGVLEKGENTGNLLEKINIATNIDLGYYEIKDYYYIGNDNTDKYEISDEQWQPYTVTRTDGKVTDIKIDDASVGDLNNDGETDEIDMAKYLDLGEGQKLFRKNESILSEDNKGYADANYTLTITSEFVQATSDAVLDAWESGGFKSIDDVKNFLNNVTSDSENTVLLKSDKTETVTP